ncbi:Protein-disulfide reductase [Acanthamoeba castellanii str. Neff]|uniref:protein-disulfide reductase n=1 Tax=Acanthamoeba castellanii (strain ATCC 30010 / Neff) TaxID=1257118 RepID=L8H1X3_ACACF|nr:Protein-disulfide reductase [Acanthamoeba castellanii str. Neff]ELR19494.1 Protein-disulfide reductase [Acanthamoeba castellanii str. Neff]
MASTEEGWGELLGEEDLVVWAEGKLTPVPVQEVLANKQFVGLYFSAHWCPPCRGFTPLLVDTYNELLQQQQTAGQGGFQVIFVSSDRDAGAMGAYMRDAAMPWPALPFGDPRVAALKAKFQVSSIPTLVILNGEGKLVTRDGRAAVLKSGPGAFGKW